MTKASPTIGGGHALRCIGLAEAMQQRGIQPVFAVSHETLETVELLAKGSFKIVEIAESGMNVNELAAETQVAIFDSYEWDAAAERPWGGRGVLRVVIDDLANRQHDCDIVVDHTPGRQPASYQGLVSPGCEVLAGPEYALLRPEFRRLRPGALQRRTSAFPRRVLVSMGLTDVRGITRRAVEGALLANSGWMIDAVVGHRAESLPWLQSAAATGRIGVHVDVGAAAMAELMARADLAVGGGGGTSLERCCMGLPSLTILLADNQRLIAETLSQAGATRLIGSLENATPQAIASALRAFAADAAERQRCVDAAASVVDGRGADRVCAAILEKLAVRK